jgi:hypothetical protein
MTQQVLGFATLFGPFTTPPWKVMPTNSLVCSKKWTTTSDTRR